MAILPNCSESVIPRWSLFTCTGSTLKFEIFCLHSFQLTLIYPSMIQEDLGIGPAVDPNATIESANVIDQFVKEDQF